MTILNPPKKGREQKQKIFNDFSLLLGIIASPSFFLVPSILVRILANVYIFASKSF
jgi:hypothetical protein